MSKFKVYQKARIVPKYWDDKIEEQRRVARVRGVHFEQKPVTVHYIGNTFEFNPDAELPEHIARALSVRRWYIELVGKPYTKTEVNELPTDAKDEDDQKYGEMHLCKYCGWPFPKAMSRATHERRWCKRKDDK